MAAILTEARLASVHYAHSNTRTRISNHSNRSHPRVVEHAQGEFVDLVVIDEIQDTPDEEFAGSVTLTSAIFVDRNNTFSRHRVNTV